MDDASLHFPRVPLCLEHVPQPQKHCLVPGEPIAEVQRLRNLERISHRDYDRRLGSELLDCRKPQRRQTTHARVLEND